jgi:H+/gluconate symporter-like permease
MTYWPLVVLLLSVGLVVLLITLVRLHPFLSLILAAIVTGQAACQGSRRTAMPSRQLS